MKGALLLPVLLLLAQGCFAVSEVRDFEEEVVSLGLRSRRSRSSSLRLVSALLALFLGGLGVHHFYMGRTLAGVLSLLLCWTFIPAMFALVEVLFCWLIVDGYNERQLSSQLNLMGV